MIPTYTKCAHPLAQLEVVESFAEAIESYIQDEWKPAHDGLKPKLKSPYVEKILDALSALGLRLELDGTDAISQDGYFQCSNIGRMTDNLLYMYVHKFSDMLIQKINGGTAQWVMRHLGEEHIVLVQDIELTIPKTLVLLRQS